MEPDRLPSTPSSAACRPRPAGDFRSGTRHPPRPRSGRRNPRTDGARAPPFRRPDACEPCRRGRRPGALPRAGRPGAQRRHPRFPANSAAREETDHLAWCETRLAELGSRPSLLNPLWYAGSFAIGLLAAVAGRSREPRLRGRDRAPGRRPPRLSIWRRLAAGDQRSRAIVEAMKSDEVAHASGRLRPEARAADAGRTLMRMPPGRHDRHGVLALTQQTTYCALKRLQF